MRYDADEVLNSVRLTHDSCKSDFVFNGETAVSDDPQKTIDVFVVEIEPCIEREPLKSGKDVGLHIAIHLCAPFSLRYPIPRRGLCRHNLSLSCTTSCTPGFSKKQRKSLGFMVVFVHNKGAASKDTAQFVRNIAGCMPSCPSFFFPGSLLRSWAFPSIYISFEGRLFTLSILSSSELLGSKEHRSLKDSGKFVIESLQTVVSTWAGLKWGTKSKAY